MKIKFLFFYFSICILTACQPKSFKLQAGDLLFQEWYESDFAKAINKVTQGESDKDYAHVGLVLDHKGELKVLEAIQNGGVVFTSIDNFLNASTEEDGRPRISVGRLKENNKIYIPAIQKWAIDQLQKPYDTLFIYGNNKYYCSELIHDAFNINTGTEIFKLQPMTYIDPETKQVFPIWNEYFTAMKQEIPEGKPGINPGGMSRSEELTIVYRYN